MITRGVWGWKPIGSPKTRYIPRRHLSAKRSQVEEQQLPNSRIRLTLTANPAFNQEVFDGVLKDLQAKTKVSGFRKGIKAPLHLLYSAAGGEKMVKGRVIENIVEKAIGLVQEKYTTAIQGTDSLDTNLQEIVKDFNVENPLVFDISFDVLTPLKWKSPYEDIKVEVYSSGNDATDEVKVDLEIKQMLKQKGITRVVAERGMQDGDLGIVDIDFVRLDKNEQIPGMKQEKFAFDTDMDDGLKLFPYLEGMKIGEEREFDVIFPDDWTPQMYRGVKARVYTNMRELFEWELPEFNDEFMTSIDQTTNMTAAEFKEQLMASAASQRKEKDDFAIQDAICDELATIVDMEIAESAILETGKSKYMDQLIRLQTQQNMSMEAMQQLATPELVNKYIENHRDELEKYQCAISALDSIAKEKGLEASDEEIEEEYNKAKQDFEKSQEQFDPERLRDMCKEVLGTQKVVQWFKDNGCVTVKEYQTKAPQTVKSL